VLVLVVDVVLVLVVDVVLVLVVAVVLVVVVSFIVARPTNIAARPIKSNARRGSDTRQHFLEQTRQTLRLRRSLFLLTFFALPFVRSWSILVVCSCLAGILLFIGETIFDLRELVDITILVFELKDDSNEDVCMKKTKKWREIIVLLLPWHSLWTSSCV
jgi:hypothetical protein